jgi:hypothetical protein
MREEVRDRILPDGVGPSVQVEKAALRETQALLGRRTVSAACGLVSAALVFACLPEEVSALVAALRRGGVWLAALLCALSLAFWWRFYQACVRLNALGLYRRPRGISVLHAWAFAGALTGVAVAITASALAGRDLGHFLPLAALLGSTIAHWLGRRLSHLPDAGTAREEELAKRSILQKDDG